MDFSRFPLHKKQVIVISPSLVLIPSVFIFSHKPSAPDQTESRIHQIPRIAHIFHGNIPELRPETLQRHSDSRPVRDGCGSGGGSLV